jgi:hypothetical protein
VKNHRILLNKEEYFPASYGMNAAAPEGTPPRRINNKYSKKNFPDPPCPGEALRRVTSFNEDHLQIKFLFI